MQQTALQKAICDRLVGLPFVTLGPDKLRFVAKLNSGEKARAGQIEEIFNAGLIIEALEGPGAAARQSFGNPQADALHAELVSIAERLFGISIREALPIYLKMERTSYGAWDHRPRVLWPRPAVN